MDARSGHERRRSPRRVRPLPCLAWVGEAGSPLKAMIGDISAHGALLCLGGRAAAGDRIRLSFALAAEQFDQAPGSVVWSRPTPSGSDCGVAFSPDLAGRLEPSLRETGEPLLLLLEDDPALRASLERHLTAAGWNVETASSLAQAQRMFQDREFDLLLSDLNLPDGDGMDLVSSVRGHASRGDTPIIILTADAKLERKVGGLALGADQYVVKPADPVDLLFSAAALLRSSGRGPVRATIRFERGLIDPASRLVRLGDAEFRGLTRKEFDLLYELVGARPKVLSRRDLLAKLWGPRTAENTVETHVRRLREKLGAQGAQRLATVPGKGYKFV